MQDKKKRGRPPGTTKVAMEERRRQEIAMPINPEVAATEQDPYEIGSTDVLMAQAYGEGNLFAMQHGGMLPKLPGTLNLTVPRPDDYISQTRWAVEFRSLKFIKGPLLRRRKFIISGFKHHHADPKVIGLFDKIVRDTKFVKTLKSIQWEKDTVGWVVVWPDQMNLVPKVVHMLQGNIKIDRTMGFDRIVLVIDQKMADAIKKYPDRFPDYFFEAVSTNRSGFRTEVELEGAYLVSHNRDIGEAYPKSPLYPLFEPIKVIENLIETEYAISFAVKQLIMHIKVKGEIDNNNKQKFATRAQIQAVARQVMNGAKTTNIITDAGVEIEFVSPSKDIFEATAVPYNQAMGRIGDNIGIPMLLVSGKADGVSYSTATFIIKGFLQDVVDEREDLLADFVYPWYKEISQRLYESNPKKYAFLKKVDPDGIEEDDWQIPLVQFNETELKNIVELLATLKFLQDTGAHSIESAMEMLQLDFRTEKSRKVTQDEDDGWIFRPYEPSQGMSHNQGFENPAQVNVADTKNRFGLDSKVADQNNDIQKQQVDVQRQGIQVQKVQAAAKLVQAKKAPAPMVGAPVTKKPAAAAGRPAKTSAAPTASKTNRNPRTSTASIDPLEMEEELENGYIIEGENEVTISELLDHIDDPDALDQLLKPRSLKFFERFSDKEDINE
jgi:hypothetical protein